MLEVPALTRIQKEYKSEKIQILAINLFAQYSLEYWQSYLKKFGGENLVIARDTTGQAMRIFKIRTSGSTVILNRQGQVVYRDGSATPYPILKSAVEKAL
ncbi:MAG: hypothetical protein COB67_06280 [SAR324 cluster bacterium]|uniref:Alkyl hydroperoxide reductase subunit C/ Thiol specific antioxidant domain-containing protein n=1 Tax=SAR324 cluster bacterium TaxID=2024889 RepID=A0A2A4T4T2_9DELT|nr:MAG: hypothetical protein COB67_06280 [SAR324 cluster bacterium]